MGKKATSRRWTSVSWDDTGWGWSRRGQDKPYDNHSNRSAHAKKVRATKPYLVCGSCTGQWIYAERVAKQPLCSRCGKAWPQRVAKQEVSTDGGSKGGPKNGAESAFRWQSFLHNADHKKLNSADNPEAFINALAEEAQTAKAKAAAEEEERLKQEELEKTSPMDDSKFRDLLAKKQDKTRKLAKKINELDAAQQKVQNCNKEAQHVAQELHMLDDVISAQEVLRAARSASPPAPRPSGHAHGASDMDEVFDQCMKHELMQQSSCKV